MFNLILSLLLQTLFDQIKRNLIRHTEREHVSPNCYVMRYDCVIRDCRRAQVLVKLVRVAHCSRTVQKKSEKNDKSVLRRGHRRREQLLKRLTHQFF